MVVDGLAVPIPMRVLPVSNTKFAEAPKLPELLNCICVFVPAGEPEPPVALRVPPEKVRFAPIVKGLQTKAE
jgi:hypothetical protein